MKTPLKLIGDRVLFIVVSFIFMVPLTFLSTKYNGIIYSFLTAAPYLSLIYYDMWDLGHKEGTNAKALKGLRYVLISEIPTAIILFFYLISHNALTRIIYIIWMGPFCGTAVNTALGLNGFLPIYIIAPVLEIGIASAAYALGNRDISILAKLRIGKNKK